MPEKKDKKGTVDGKNPVNNGIVTISTGEGKLPSTDSIPPKKYIIFLDHQFSDANC